MAKSKRPTSILFIEIFSALLLLFSCGSSSANDTDHPVIVAERGDVDFEICKEFPASVIFVDSGNQFLYLCVDHQVEKAFPVSFGSRGLGKSRAGDRKTPLGQYPIQLVNSPGYGPALSVGYPTASQKKRGYTGGLILVHGPSKNMNNDFLQLQKSLLIDAGPSEGKELYSSVLKRIELQGLASVNWTAGCLGLGSKEDIMAILDEVKSKKIAQIIIK